MRFTIDLPYTASVLAFGLVLIVTTTISWDSWQFWSLIGLQWVAFMTGKNSGLGQGRIETLAFLKMAETDMNEAQDLYTELTGNDPRDYNIKE
jgi:hypothetical protein